MKVFVSKYALTDGIQTVTAQLLPSGNIIFGTGNIVHRNQWHKTREAAIEAAEKMRTAKIISLKAQIEKLTEMRFE